SKITSASNINVVKSTSTYASIAYADSLSNIASEPTEYPTTDAMLSSAKKFFGDNYSQIWDVDKIGGTYTSDTSPVRNYLVAFVNYRNLIDGGSDEESVGIEDEKLYIPNENLEDQPSADYLAGKSDNQIFLGWTNDITGASKPFKKLPSGMFGHVTLYAVWGLPSEHVEKYINPTLSVKDDVSEITYDTKASITLNAKVEYTGASNGGMTDPQVTYLWKQGNKDRNDTKSSSFIANKVADSGEYTYDYIMNDKIQPLWLYQGSSEENGVSKTITINKGVLSLQSFDLTSKPFYGKNLSELEYNLKIKNSADIEVSIAQSDWSDPFGVVKKGSNNPEMTIVPSDTDNYESSYSITNIQFNSEALLLKFEMAQLLGQELRVEVEYGQNYGSKEIIYKFNTVYLDALANNPAFKSIADRGMAPYLADADEIKENPSYQGAPIVEDSSGNAIYDGQYNNIREEYVITVFFKEVTYKVSF
ncbi:MAG: hypothetical protein K2J75_05695, partial [Clostridia bacterium]|nr:hypothetical protein [Clostridia bacterium]